MSTQTDAASVAFGLDRRMSNDRIAAMEIRRRLTLGHWATYVLAVYLLLAATELLVFNENWDWRLVASYLFSQVVLSGLVNTIQLTVLTTIFGLMLGVAVAWCRTSRFQVLRSVALLFVWLMRAMPPLVMLLLIYFSGALIPNFSIGLPFGPSVGRVPANEVISKFSAAVVGLSIYLGAYSSEVFRGGMQAVPRGQFEACHALGLPARVAYRRVLGPQLVRNITPALANEVITIFKSTALVSVIGYTELLTTVQDIYAVNFQTIPLLTVAVVWYLVLTSLAMIGQSFLEKRFGRGFTRRRVQKSDMPSDVEPLTQEFR